MKNYPIELYNQKPDPRDLSEYKTDYPRIKDKVLGKILGVMPPELQNKYDKIRNLNLPDQEYQIAAAKLSLETRKLFKIPEDRYFTVYLNNGDNNTHEIELDLTRERKVK